MARRETGIHELFQTMNQAKPRQRLNIRDEQYAWGTVEKEGVLRLIEQLGLGNNDVFVDIGSGKGALCYHVFHNSPVKSVIGVEAVQKRHEEAAMLLSQSVNDNAILRFTYDRLHRQAKHIIEKIKENDKEAEHKRTEARSQFIGFRGEEELNKKLEKRRKEVEKSREIGTIGRCVPQN